MTTGSVLAQFTITLSQAVSEQVAVEWHTADGTALAGVDYAAAKGTVLFAPGQTAKTVDILVHGRAVGSEDRSFFVEMLPPTNAILGASIGECIIHVDTTGSTPVTQIIVPTGPQGLQGDSAYQTWLDLGNTGTEEDFINSLKPSAEDIAEEVAPLLDVSNSPLTAEGTETISKPDTMTGKRLARRVAYVGAAKVATVVLADGDNLITHAALSGDAVDFNSISLYPRILRGTVVISPEWSVEPGDKILIKSAVAGDVLHVCEYDVISERAVRSVVERLVAPVGSQAFEALRRSYAEAGYNLVAGSFEEGGTLVNTNDVLLYEANGEAYSYLGIIPSGGYDVAPITNPVGDSDWTPRTDENLRHELAAGSGSNLIGFSQPNSTTPNIRTLEDKVSEKISISDFGLVDFTGVIDASPIVRKAIAYAITITDVSGTDNYASKSVTINMGRGIIRIDSTVLVPRNVVITSDGAAIVSDSDDFVFESGYVLNCALVSNMGLSDNEAIANRLVGTRLDNLTFYRCSRAIRMRAFNEQCGLQRLRFYKCGTAYAVYQAFYSNYKDMIIRQAKSGFDNLPAVVYGRASNRISTDEIYIVGRSKGIEFGEPGAFEVYGSASCQFSGLSLEVLNEGFKFIGKMRNIDITGSYIEQVSSVFFDTDGDVKHKITIKDSYSYSSAFYVDMSGLRDSFIGGVTDAADPVNKAVVQLRDGSFGNTATVEVYGLDDGTTGNNRYRLSIGVVTTGALIKYTGGPYSVLKSQEFAYNNPISKYAKQVPVCDIGWYGTAQNYVIGTVSGDVSKTQGTEIYALTNFFYSEYTALNYSIKVTPNVGSGVGGATPSPVLLKGVVIGGHATQIVPNGMSVSSVRDNTTGTVRLNFGPFGSIASDPAFAWMRNGLFTSEGIIKLIA